MIKEPTRRNNTHPIPGALSTVHNTKKSLSLLQELLASLWVGVQSVPNKRKYCSAMQEINDYHQTITDTQKLYDYYELYRWPIDLEKINKLKAKYNRPN